MTIDDLKKAIREELDWLDAHSNLGGLYRAGTLWSTQHLRAFLDSPKFNEEHELTTASHEEVFDRR